MGHPAHDGLCERLIAILNAEFSPPLWSDDRVENAKKRLLNWIQRLMRQNGLDATELEALLRESRASRSKNGCLRWNPARPISKADAFGSEQK